MNRTDTWHSLVVPIFHAVLIAILQTVWVYLCSCNGNLCAACWWTPGARGFCSIFSVSWLNLMGLHWVIWELFFNIFCRHWLIQDWVIMYANMLSCLPLICVDVCLQAQSLFKPFKLDSILIALLGCFPSFSTNHMSHTQWPGPKEDLVHSLMPGHSHYPLHP